MDSFKLTNVGIDKELYIINEHITLLKSLKRENEIIVQSAELMNVVESSGVLFFHALQLAIPKANLRVSYSDFNNKEHETLYNVLKNLNTPLINYYGVNNDNLGYFNTSTMLTERDINHLKEIHKIVTEYNKIASERRKDNNWIPNNWTLAYNKYISACSEGSIEEGILNIISGLEALLVNGGELLSFKVSLYTAILTSDDIEERKSIRNFISKMYNIRSKVIHGDVRQMIKLLKSEDIYTKYFKLKEIFSYILVKLYSKDEQVLMQQLDDILLNVPPLKLD